MSKKEKSGLEPSTTKATHYFVTSRFANTTTEQIGRPYSHVEAISATPSTSRQDRGEALTRICACADRQSREKRQKVNLHETYPPNEQAEYTRGLSR